MPRSNYYFGARKETARLGKPNVDELREIISPPIGSSMVALTIGL